MLATSTPATRTLRFDVREVGARPAARMYYDPPSFEPVSLIAVSMSQPGARIVEAAFVPMLVGVALPITLFSHKNVLGIRQWAPLSPQLWSPRYRLCMRIEDVVPGALYVTTHFEPAP